MSRDTPSWPELMGPSFMIGVVGINDQPYLLDKCVIDRFLDRYESDYYRRSTVHDTARLPDFKVGDHVRVLAGPLETHIVPAKKMNQKQALIVANILGKDCEIAMRLDDLRNSPWRFVPTYSGRSNASRTQDNILRAEARACPTNTHCASGLQSSKAVKCSAVIPSLCPPNYHLTFRLSTKAAAFSHVPSRSLFFKNGSTCCKNSRCCRILSRFNPSPSIGGVSMPPLCSLR